MSKNPLNLNEIYASDLLGAQSNADTLDGLDSESFMRRDATTFPTVDNMWELGTPLLRWKKIYAKEIELDGNDIFEFMMKRNRDNLPTITDTWDLGSSNLKWRNIYSQKIYADVLYLKNQQDPNTNISISSQDLTHYLKDDKINEPVFDKVYDLGTVDKKWRNIHVYDVYGTTIRATDKFIGDLDGVALKAKYADLAEVYKCNASLKIGTIVAVTENHIYDVESCNNTTLIKSVVGVISENPAYLMNKEETGLPVGLTGKLNVRVKGIIKKGDIIVPSGIDGIGRKILEDEKNLCPIFIISLEDNNNEEEKLVMCIVR